MFQNSECSATLNDELDGLSDAGTYIVDDEDIDEKTSTSSFKQSVLRHDTFEIQGFLSSYLILRMFLMSIQSILLQIKSLPLNHLNHSVTKPKHDHFQSFLCLFSVISPTSRRRTNPPMPKFALKFRSFGLKMFIC